VIRPKSFDIFCISSRWMYNGRLYICIVLEMPRIPDLTTNRRSIDAKNIFPANLTRDTATVVYISKIGVAVCKPLRLCAMQTHGRFTIKNVRLSPDILLLTSPYSPLFTFLSSPLFSIFLFRFRLRMKVSELSHFLNLKTMKY
jgi:hypothetical protein